MNVRRSFWRWRVRRRRPGRPPRLPPSRPSPVSSDASLDQSGAALPGVTVTVTSKDTGAVRTDVTDGEGHYTITNLGPGTYSVGIELERLRSRRSATSSLGVGQTQASRR